MGNHPSTSSKPQTPTGQSSGSATPHGHDSHSPRHSRNHTRSILQHSTHHRSAAPPEASLAQAQGSTIVSRPKSLPGTAVSSLSGSPRSIPSTPTSRDLASRMERASESRSFAKQEPTKPVDVPMESGSHSSAMPHAHYNSDMAATQGDAALLSNGSVTDAYPTHPPRLPLPIEEEIHTPGSPILAAEPEQGLPDVGELGESSADILTRKSSGLSAGTADDEDSEELRVDKTRPVVPTKLEWKRGGDKIYVTGSIFQWNRKHRLHPAEGKPGCFSATIHVLPGTHHVRFLVDGIMQTSPDLPTTVDFGNNLVNYIEVSPDDAPKTKPTPSGTAKATDSSDARASRTSSAQSTGREDKKQAPKGKDVPPPESYRNEIPQYLQDFDQAEDSPAYQNAVAAIEKLPTPPSLPGFLGKPILNAAVLMKDDNSVLNMPNHTVLNHLATSSIKNGVLAVSATTRYRNKYVTTIIYKPTSADEG